jgi:di/tricarboxylate transporter
MAVAGQAGIPAFLMAIMVGNGSNAGSLSPFAPTGVIVNGLMMKIGLGGHEWQTYANNLVAHAVVALSGYLLFGGWRLFTRGSTNVDAALGDEQPLEVRHWATLAAIGVLIAGVVVFQAPVGMLALACAVTLTLARFIDEKEAIRAMPWGVIIMVSGVTVLISLLEKTKGLDLFTDLLARTATEGTITGVIAALTGLVSVYSSTSGVVLPAFLPTIPGIVERLGGGNPLAIASSMNVGGHLVDVSPLSTIGALCLAGAAAGTDTRALFNKLLAWGLSMAPIGGLICWMIFR